MAGIFSPATPGIIGDIYSRWSVQEDATTHVPGQSSGTTGTVNVQAESKSNSLFLMDNTSSFTATKKDGTQLGTVSGRITSVATSGINAGFTQSAGLAQFVPERYIPAVSSGSPTAAVDLCLQLAGTKFCSLNNPGQVYWSGRGHESGFDVNGNLVQPYDASTVAPYNLSLLTFTSPNTAVRNAFTITQYNGTNFTPRVTYALGPSPTVTAGMRTLVMHRNTSTNYNWFTVVYPATPGVANTGKSFRVYVDWVAATMTITGTYTTGAGTTTVVNQSVSISSVVSSGTPTQILFDMNWIDSTHYELTAYLISTDPSFVGYVSVTTGSLNTVQEISAARWQVACVGTDFYQMDADQTFTPSSLLAPYLNTLPYQSVAAMAPASGFMDAPIVPYNGSMWDYLNQVSSASHADIYASGGLVSLRPTGSVPITVDSFVPTPQISASTQSVGQNVNITNYNATIVQNQVIYDAGVDNTSWSAVAGETTTSIITTPNAVNFVYNPFAADDYSSYLFYKNQSVPGGIAANTRTNVARNPDLEGGTTLSWVAQSGATLANSTAQHSTGTRSLAVTTSTTSGSGVTTQPAVSTDWSGRTIAGSVDLFIPTGRTVNVDLRVLAPTDTLVSATTTVTGTGAWQRIAIAPAVTPSGVTSEPYLYIRQNTAGPAMTFYVDVADVEANVNPITVPFSGNTPATDSTIYAWTGTADFSPSTATPNGYRGAYVVTDSTNAIVPSYSWVSYGGAVSLSLIDTNHIQMVITAPIIPGFVGPYSLTGIDGTGTEVPALVIVGSGVISSPTVTNFITGASPTFTSNLQVGDVDNVAIGSSSRQFSAAMWVGSISSGPTLQLTAAMTVDNFSAFGSIGGGTLFYQNQRWRIINATVTNLVVNITAIPYTTVGDYQSVWTGKLISDVETAWSGKQQDDFNIQPLNLTP